jgi:hypothetical protein
VEMMNISSTAPIHHILFIIIQSEGRNNTAKKKPTTKKTKINEKSTKANQRKRVSKFIIGSWWSLHQEE